MTNPNVCVLNAPGINCNNETANMFSLAQYELDPSTDPSVEQVHISQLRSGDKALSSYQILALPGGFSHGDDIAAGRVLGTELRTKLGEDINRFIDAGGLILAICNGDQVAVDTGLIPAGKVTKNHNKTAALTANDSREFDDRWGWLKVSESRCLFVDPNELGELIELPWAHGEGKFLLENATQYKNLFANQQVVFQYAKPDGKNTQEFPYNPNGSPCAIAGVCDPSGQVLGMMPHPERFVDRWQHPDVRRRAVGPPAGLVIAKKMLQIAA
jgi:phosphoribosylformylglycinamidine synthase subunit PurQ / glutaminase